MSDLATQLTDQKSTPTVGRPSEAVMDIYAGGVIPFNWIGGMPGNWYPYFMTDILMLSPALTGIISLISRLSGLFIQPIAGGLIDRSNPKGGKYRFWIRATVPLAATLSVLLFINYTALGFSVGATATLVTILFILFSLCTSFGLASHIGLFAALTPDTESRVKLTTRRAMGQSASNITLGMLAMPLVAFLGAGNEGKGFLYTMILFAALAVVGYWAITVVIKPWDPVGISAQSSKPATSPPTLKEMLAHIFTNPPLAVFMVSDALRWGSRMMLVGFAIYNLKYVFGSMMLMASFMTSINLVSFVCTALGEPFTKKFNKGRTYLWGNVLLFASILAAFLMSRNSAVLYMVLIAIGHIGYGPSAAQPPAYYAECAEWAEMKTGKSAKTLVMSVSYFAMYIGIVLSTVLTGYCLAMIGYDPKVAVTPELVDGIYKIASLVPALLLGLSILATLYYNKNCQRWFGEKSSC